MQEVVSAPVFVLITGIAEILIVIFAAIVFAYAVIIAKNISDITKLAKKEADKIASDLEEARQDIKSGVEMTKKRISMLVGALSVQRAFSLVMNGVQKATTRRKARRAVRKNKKTEGNI